MAFVQFQRCDICCKNHNAGSKHIYSQCHSSNVTKICKKFKHKVVEARRTMKEATVEDGNKQDMKQFWCYFCVQECERDRRLNSALLKDAAMIEHLSSVEHLRNCTSFLAANRLEQALRKDFVITTEEYEEFQKAIQNSVRQFEEKKLKRQLGVADKIRKDSFISARMVGCYREMCGRVDSHQRLPVVDGCNTSEGSRTKGVCTADAHGEGLTCVTMKKAGNVTGNIYSDAPPPWAQQGATSGTAGVIGPTLDDLDKHVEATRKRKLPAGRVGADFKHKDLQTNTWMPSFGRVWSKKRSSNVRGRFVKHRREDT